MAQVWEAHESDGRRLGAQRLCLGSDLGAGRLHGRTAADLDDLSRSAVWTPVWKLCNTLDHDSALGLEAPVSHYCNHCCDARPHSYVF